MNLRLFPVLIDRNKIDKDVQHEQVQFYRAITVPTWRSSVYRLLVLGFCTLLLIGLPSSQASAADSAGRIAGIVTDRAGNPLAGIEVDLYKFQPYTENNGGIWETYGTATTTDAAGAYQSLFLEPGQYTVRFADPNDYYAFTFYQDATQLTNATKIDVIANQTTHRINAQLAPGGVITGTIQLYNGTPISQVEPQRFTGANFYPFYSRGSMTIYHHDGQTWQPFRVIDFDGDPRLDLAANSYRVGGLAVGVYQLGYALKYGNGVDPDITSHCAYLNNIGHQYTGTYPPDITLTADQMVQTHHLVIGDNPRYGRFQGKVTAHDGTPLAGMVLMITYSSEAGSASDECAGITDQSGHYASPALAPGDYQIAFFDPTGHYAPAYYGKGMTLATTPPLPLEPGANVTNIDVVLPLGKQLVGQLRMADGRPVDGAVELTLVREVAEPDHFVVYRSTAYDAEAGVYRISGLPSGAYALEYKIHHAGIEYATPWPSPIRITLTASDVTQFDLTIPQSAAQSGAIRGQVTNAAGTPLAGIHVSYGGPTFDEANTTTDSQGFYELHPGSGPDLSYLIAFADPQRVYGFEYYNDAPYAAAATALPMITNTVYSDINAVLVPGARISGHITLLDGTPLSQVNPHEVDPLTGKLIKGTITLTYHNGNHWQALQTVQVSEQSTAIFDLATNTYSFGGLATGRYRINIQTTHNGVAYVSTDANPGAEVNLTAGDNSQTDIVLGKDDQQVLALYALALDNDPDRLDNLAPQLTPAMQSIQTATATDPNKIAVVLADAAGEGDTRIYVVQGGRALPVNGLPDATLTLNPSLTEYNMADGAQLGHFIRWARNSYPAHVTIFSYVGHGAPLTPAVTWETISNLPTLGRQQAPQSLFPLPARVDTYPSLTDQHPPALISPHALAEALRIGTNNGAAPLQIADITHCFAATLEELYELSPGAQPFAEIILASPTYTYLDPPALGNALAAINTTFTPERMADKIIEIYDHLLDLADKSDGDDAVEHPRLLVAVNSRQVARLKADWDQVAYALLQTFDAEKLRQAYLASPHYDTTLCRPQDWELGAPDALTDLAGLAAALQQVYGATSAVGQAAAQVLTDFQSVITGKYVRNGAPWYATRPDVFWNFDAHGGIALFTDLQGRPSPTPNTVELNWQTHWYTADNTQGDNPHPFAFVQPGANGATWADVLAEYWRRQGATLVTVLCAPDPIVNPQMGELRAAAIVYPITGTIGVGAPVHLAAAVQTAGVAIKPSVQFNLYDANQSLLFSDTVRVGYLITGVHQIAATRLYTPSASGTLRVEVIVDPQNHFQESNEADNRLVQAYTVAAAGFQAWSIAARLAEHTPLVKQERAPLVIESTPGSTLAELKADLYQYTQDGQSGRWLPQLVSAQQLDPAAPALTLLFLKPGPVVAHLWGRRADGVYSQQPAVLLFNYALPIRLQAGESQYYLIPETTALTLALLTPISEANLFAWSAFNQWSPDWRAMTLGDDSLSLPTLSDDEIYIVAVYAERASQYALAASKTDTAGVTINTEAAAGIAYIPYSKPVFLAPIVLPPQQTQAEFIHIERTYFPFASYMNAAAQYTPPVGPQLLYRDQEDGFSFEYPSIYEKSPLRENNCGLKQELLQSADQFGAQAGDRFITFGDSIYLTIISAHGLSLEEYVEEFAQRLKTLTPYLTRDDERFDREPRGYFFQASFSHHNNPIAIFGREDTIYLFVAHLSLACGHEESGVTMEGAFWHALDSFRFTDS